MNEYDDILNRIVEEFYDTGKLILEARGKRLTNDELRNIALNYKTRGEWAEKDKNSYQQAIKRGKEIPGFYEDITSHMGSDDILDRVVEEYFDTGKFVF